MGSLQMLIIYNPQILHRTLKCIKLQLCNNWRSNLNRKAGPLIFITKCA